MTEYYGTCPKSRWSCSNRSIEAMLGYTTDRWTDTVPFHRPCSAYYTSSTNILWRTFISYLRDLITHLAKHISLLDTAVTAGPYWLQVEGDSWLKSVWLGSNGLRANERQQFLSCPWRQKNWAILPTTHCKQTSFPRWVKFREAFSQIMGILWLAICMELATKSHFYWSVGQEREMYRRSSAENANLSRATNTTRDDCIFKLRLAPS